MAVTVVASPLEALARISASMPLVLRSAEEVVSQAPRPRTTIGSQEIESCFIDRFVGAALRISERNADYFWSHHARHGDHGGRRPFLCDRPDSSAGERFAWAPRRTSQNSIRGQGA